MRNNFYQLNVPTSAGVGAAQNTRDLRDKYIQVAGSFVASFSIEASLDGIDYFTVQSGVSAPGWIAIPQPAASVRVNTSSYTSGTPKVILAGFDANG